MGLTSRSTGSGVLTGGLKIVRCTPEEKIIALAGNPNVGKSTVFNSLTGMNQHTGNWPGKTVVNAQGRYKHQDRHFIMVDIPGTYSIMANSAEEEAARDFICFGSPDAVVVVADATCLERNLNLVLQIMEVTRNVVVCVNLLDEAARKGIIINLRELEDRLGVPVVGTNARDGEGLNELMDAVYAAAGKEAAAPFKILYDGSVEKAITIVEPHLKKLLAGKLDSRWAALRLLEGEGILLKSLQEYIGSDLTLDIALSQKVDEAREFLRDSGINSELLRDLLVTRLVSIAEMICSRAVIFSNERYNYTDRKIDRILTSRIWGFPIMIGLLGVIFWLTLIGANYPSEMLAAFFSRVQEHLTYFFMKSGMPAWVHGVLVLGIFRTLAWVVAVMLPPMAIFFPLFTLLEDLGYLPRVAFNLDSYFKKACAHGKQALTMCMGFGCNAAGIIGCRIIESPRERLIATITNSFVPCNGRFPTLIAIITMFFAGVINSPFQSVVSTLMLTGVIIFGVMMTFFVSRVLTQTILKGLPSSFALELPPFRRPQIGRVIIRSIFDRTLFVLGRAVVIAAPAGLIIWVMANINAGGLPLLTHCAGFLDPFAWLLGMDGYILMAFILGFPANEIVVPIIIMSYITTGSITQLDSLEQLRQLLVSHGWTWLTAICVMLFSLMHWPCGTTCWTIKKETQSFKWTMVSILIPAVTGITICLIVANTIRLLGLV